MFTTSPPEQVNNNLCCCYNHSSNAGNTFSSSSSTKITSTSLWLEECSIQNLTFRNQTSSPQTEMNKMQSTSSQPGKRLLLNVFLYIYLIWEWIQSINQSYILASLLASLTAAILFSIHVQRQHKRSWHLKV